MVAKGISNLAFVDKRHLEDGSRRNASSDMMNMAQTCTLAIRRTPQWALAIGMRPTNPREIRKRKISKERLLLPH